MARGSKKNLVTYFALAAGLALPAASFAKDIEYTNQEVVVHVTPGEPTQLDLPADISGGFKRKSATVTVDKNGSSLVLFAQEGLPEAGEAMIVRLVDGRSYSIRIQKATPEFPRDAEVRLLDTRDSPMPQDEEEPPYKEKQFEYAPASQVSGLMREMMLAGEFGKSAVPGYRASDRYQGETVLHDGTIHATIDKIFIGPNLWGYVINAENLLDQTQKLNPASFRIDGTRAISASNWELAPKPLNVEQQVAGKDKTKIYVVTRAR